MGHHSLKYLILLCLLFGCSPGPEEHGDWLLRRLGSEPDTLNPITATDYYEETVNRYVTETMLWRDYETLEIEPQIPCTWTESDDHLVYIFEFQPGILWHDGVELTADDVVYSFQKIMDPKVDCAHYRNYFKDIETVQKTGKNSFRVVWKKPYFRSLEMSGGIPLVPKHVFDDGAGFNKNPAGRHPIQARCMRLRIAVAAQRIPRLLIRENKYQIRTTCLASRARSRKRRRTPCRRLNKISSFHHSRPSFRNAGSSSFA